MPLTVASGGDAYLTAAEFLRRVDVRIVGQWFQDLETSPGVPAPPLTESQVLSNPDLAVILKQASGRLEQALLTGARYSVEDLLALIDSDTNGAEDLKGVVAGVAFGMCWQRRPRTDPRPYPTISQESDKVLERLREGTHILPFAEAAEAGIMRWGRFTEEDRLRAGLVTSRLGRFFVGRGYWQG